MRVILFAGKGGVGKTSLAAATGIQLSSRGKRTLILSVDPAHSLADSFDLDEKLLDLGQGLPVPVGDNLWIQELNIQHELERHWSEIFGYVAALLQKTGLDDIVAEETAIFPGMEELNSLLYVNSYARSGEFEYLILDCAPTGESLRFISMPTTLDWYMRHVFKLERNLFRLVRPVARTVTSLPLPDDRYFGNIQDLFLKLEGVDRILVDPATTTVRLVSNPEKMVIRETQRAFLYFCLYGMTVDCVILNKVIPSRARGAFIEKWRAVQREYIAKAREYFTPVPVRQVSQLEGEVVGREGLAGLARDLYGSDDPGAVFYNQAPYRFQKEEGRYKLRIRVPFASASDVNLAKSGDELVVSLGGFKRHVALPKAMAALEPESARIKDGELVVVFGGDGDATKSQGGREEGS